MLIPLDSLDPRNITKLAVDGYGKPLSKVLELAPSLPELRFIPADGHTFVNTVPAGVDKYLTLKNWPAAKVSISPIQLRLVTISPI